MHELRLYLVARLHGITLEIVSQRRFDHLWRTSVQSPTKSLAADRSAVHGNVTTFHPPRKGHPTCLASSDLKRRTRASSSRRRLLE